jgi:hypothetical protein
MSVDRDVRRGGSGLVRLVREGLPLAELSDAGYTPFMFEAVMRQLVGFPHEVWSVRALEKAAKMPSSVVRHVCRDLVDLGHLTVDEGMSRGAVSLHRHRLSPEGLAYWGGPVVAHDWLHDADLWRDPRLVPVMGARLSAEDRARGEAVGYSLPVVYRVADALVLVPSREWRIEDLVTAAGAAEEMVRLACRDLVAAGHASAHEPQEDGREEREETRFKISLAGMVAWLPWMPDPLDY